MIRLFSLAVLFGLVSSSVGHYDLKAAVDSSESIFVNIPDDHHFPTGFCKPANGGCDLRGAWNKAMANSGSYIFMDLEYTEITYSLVGKKGVSVDILGKSTGTTIALNTTIGEHHSEAIRWLDFDATAWIFVARINFQGFRLSEPGGPPVQEFGGAVNLGRTPVQHGYPGEDACHTFTDPPLSKQNVIFYFVNFTKNEFVPSHPPIHYAYGVAAAISCSGCNVEFRNVSFVNNRGNIGSSAIGIVWMNVAKYTGHGVEFKNNSISGKNFYQCPME